ncbi:hypothetical protein PL336_11750 [Sulfitobacter faviae]|uniref:Mobilization protein n=1 Tax=Sulfitobacter faviae TaxID=1775881 RepID=A0AAX3LLG0_9RHOB|nr:hypothetical protein [Sulfitobacter faviae]WCE69473.1 hypothetical protein PL336_11750 [Sulfitobacter faviae]
MPPIEKQIAALEEKIAKERAKLADAKAKAALQNRKRDTRRKVLFGYAFLDWASSLPRSERKRIVGLVHARLAEREREAFPLSDVLLSIDATAKEKTPSKPKTDPETAFLPFPAYKS